MSHPVLDLFRFLRPPTAPFPYLGAMWVIEMTEQGDHWECATTAPLRLVIALAESAQALEREMYESGVRIVRSTKAWFLMDHLITVGWVERIDLGSPV